MARSEGRSNDFTKEQVFPIGKTREIGYNKRKTIIALDKGENHVNTLLDRQIDHKEIHTKQIRKRAFAATG